jgi:hypothetical protein
LATAGIVIDDRPGVRDSAMCLAEGAPDGRGRQQSGAAGRCSCWFAVGHASRQGSVVLPARTWFSIGRRYAPARSIRACVC